MRMRRALGIGCLAFTLLQATPSPVYAAPPSIVPVQGRLTDPAGTALDGAHDLELTLYTAASGGAAVYTETHDAVPVADGDFVVYLGSDGALDLGAFRDNDALWLEVVIDGTQVIDPRFRIATLPWSASAQYCETAFGLDASVASAFAPASHTHAFGDLTGVPAGLANGDDDSLAQLACTDGQVVKRAGGAWACGEDADTILDEAAVDAMVANNGYALAASLAPVAVTGQFGDLLGVPAGLADGDDVGVTGSAPATHLPRFDANGSLIDSGVVVTGGKMGVGISNPKSTLDVAAGEISWSNTSVLGADQGGNIELGNSLGAATIPYIDFHYGKGVAQDRNVRIINAGDEALEISTFTAGRVFRVEAAGANKDRANIIAGYAGNAVSAGVEGATISGGGFSVGVNQVTANFGTVAGGLGNVASGALSVASGGDFNTASGLRSSVAGGANNTAAGAFSFVAGGMNNLATGGASFAAGAFAQAEQPGCFVWNGGTGTPLGCPAPKRFVAAAPGGVYFYTNGASSAGAFLASGSGTWSSVSDRNAKNEIRPVAGRDVLERISRLPIATWHYKDEAGGVRHMGPMAQDFAAEFGLGPDERHITTVDADGVALAAIQGLHSLAKEQAARIAALEEELAHRSPVAAAELAERLDREERATEQLRRRLERLESKRDNVAGSAMPALVVFAGAALVLSRRRRSGAGGAE